VVKFDSPLKWKETNMKNIIAGVSLFIASAICLLALSIYCNVPHTYGGTSFCFGLAWFAYLGLYFLSFARDKPNEPSSDQDV